MFRSFIAAWLLLALLPLAALTARGQATSRPDPLNAGAAVPPVIHESSFARYGAFSEQEVAPWKDTNDTAGSIGGWRAYAREAREPQSGGVAVQPGMAPSAPAGAVKPVPGGHAGHGTH